jgi:pyruvate dehydrogenase E1 component alpha subunit
MLLDLWKLYEQMLLSRRFEQAVAQLWNEGLISGEMHMGTGEEAIVAGVVDHLRDGDAMALDHRGTPPLVMRGVDLVPLLREFLGRPDGLCSGMGGHMHLFSRELLIASSGIVGASGPGAVGFALSAQVLRPEAISVAFFGEGAMNQGMLMESMNLAATWKLPVLFVCKDNGWAITTPSDTTTGGGIVERARAFGLNVLLVDGSDVESVWHAAGTAIDNARAGDDPTFLLARCTHLDAHFLDEQLLRVARNPIIEMAAIAGPMTRSLLSPLGAPLSSRVVGLASILELIRRSRRDHVSDPLDPVVRTRQKLEPELERLISLESNVEETIESAVTTALTPIPAEKPGSVHPEVVR